MNVNINTYLDKRSTKKLKPIYLQATYDGKRKKVATGIRILPSDLRKGELRFDHPEREKLENKMKELHKSITGKELEIRTSEETLPYLIDRFIKEVNHLKSETIRGYINVLNNIEAYEKQNNFNYTLFDVKEHSFQYFKGFFDYLHSKGLLNSSMTIMFSKVDKILDWYNLGFKTHQKKIFAGVNKNSGTSKILITKSQADQIYAYSGTEKENKARDMFILAYDTGLRGSELKGLDSEITERYDIGNTGQKYHTIDVTIKKNGRSRVNTVYLTDRALEILERRKMNMDLMWPTQANKLLKDICEKLGGEFLKKVTQIKYTASVEVKTESTVADCLSLHLARHSFINNLQASGLTDQEISCLVNHSSPNTTRQHYLQSDVIKSIDKLRKAN